MTKPDDDLEYEKHGGFPVFEPADPGPGFGPFLASMRQLQDLAVSADPDGDTSLASTGTDVGSPGRR